MKNAKLIIIFKEKQNEKYLKNNFKWKNNEQTNTSL